MNKHGGEVFDPNDYCTDGLVRDVSGTDSPGPMAPPIASDLATVNFTDGAQHHSQFPIAVEIENPNPIPETGPYVLTCEHDDHNDHKGWSAHYNGKGLCAPQSRIAMISDAFDLAYQVIRSAELELFYWGAQSEYFRKKYWRLRTSKGVEGTSTTLGYWFGSEAAPDFNKRFSRVEQVVTWWSYAFLHGFYNYHNPVYVICRPHHSPLGGAIARHSSINTITLYEPWFENYGPGSRAAILLHEMGHVSQPTGQGIWDRRNPVCMGKCYSEAKLNADLRFRGQDCH